MKQRIFTLFILILIIAILEAKIDETEAIGNFLLPTSQQVGPIYGFGQNIVDKGDKQLFLNGNFPNGKQKKLSLFIPGFVYGIRDDLSLYLFLPVIPFQRDGSDCSKGISDLAVQLEYTYLNRKTAKTATQGTIVGALTLPTGSSRVRPNIGLGSPSIFLGTTFAHMTEWWIIWIAGGALLTTPHKGIKFGNSYLYQAGIERCFTTYKGWIFAGLVEFIGIYQQKDTTRGFKDLNTEGNSLWIAPSLWASSEKLILQCGCAAPVVQQLSGRQNKYDYYVAFNIGYKF